MNNAIIRREGNRVVKLVACLLVLASLCIPVWVQQRMPNAYRQVASYLGYTGTFQDNVFQIDLPRDDLRISILGTRVPSSFGFTGSISMTPGNRGQQVLMAEWVLLQQEVNPIMSSLLANNFVVTAEHNHFFWESPRIIFIHFNGTGSAADLARRVKPALDMIGHIAAPAGFTDDRTAERSTNTESSTPAAAPALNTTRLDQIIGRKGERQPGGVYRFEIDRNDIRLMMNGARITERMGLHIEIYFYGSDQRAMVASEMGLLPSEVDPVERALRRAGISVTAVHNHMIGTRPEIIFVHLLGMGSAEQLARGIRGALQQTGVR